MTEDLQHLETKATLSVAETGEITGLAWPFGTVDLVGDSITPGAFDRPASLPMLAEHDSGQTIGVWSEITETDEGLTVKGKLLIHDVPRAREVADLIRQGEIGGLSIGFVTQSAQRHQKGRNITALSLREISVVKTPCNPGAAVRTLKSAIPASQENPSVENEDLALKADPKTPANDAPVIDLKAFEAVKSRLDKLEAKGNRPGAPAIVLGEQPERKAFANYLRVGEARMDAAETKALAVAANANGGYLVPPEYSAEILKLLTEMSPLRQYADVQTVTSPEITFPTLLSGVNAFWTEEGADMTVSEPTFGQVKIANHELSSFYVASNKVLEDNAYDLEGVMSREIASGFAKVEGLAFVKGTGTGQPRGLMTAPGVAEIRTGVAAAFPASNPMDVLITMQHSIPSFHARSAVWLMNRTTLATIRRFKDAQGQYLVTDPKDGGVMRLLGNPIVEMPDMDNVAAGTAPIMFGDLSGYRVFDRVDLSILRDPYTLGTKGQVRFIARKRVGADLTHADRFVKLRVAA
ncbi:phage major capsid protein [Paracoccus sp. YIM 132242]|uniref:Phage major capsid protein n=1 Tax=Paracoccus lichenicola TaxID=2665644 RepID=A0A6L6HI11_9RHOB|nr:phage major capsid protein [Paracoccus lichenicola]MTD98783.1 phage major capsid protein [Paracoccus lichenicola]